MFVEKCQNIADDLGIDILDTYEDGLTSSECEDDGILHVIEGNIRVAFDIESSSAKIQNHLAKKILKALNRKIEDKFLT